MFHRFIPKISKYVKKFTGNSKTQLNSNNSNSNMLIPSLLVSFGGFYIINNLESNKIEKIKWLELKSLLQQPDKISKIEIKNKKILVYSNYPPQTYYMNISSENHIEKKIEKINDTINIEHIQPSNTLIILSNILPSILLFGVLFYFMKRQTGGSQLFTPEAKLIEEKTGIKLSNIAGLHQTKQDVLEFSDIIMNPDKYKEIGTKIPKGILMEGPPGTGKTMLAKAIADNYDSKFYLINGSDFIQPILGTGTKKVKNLFETARKNTPAIVFIDEIDAIGKSRNTSKNIGNDERDNILNSLLVEMDGFENNDQLLIMGATNRADILDSALLRPGRFDRIVKFDLPNLEERKDILSIYYQQYQFDTTLQEKSIIQELGMLTYGFNGAQLSNLFNESSIIAIRNNCSKIKKTHIEQAIDYILLGNLKPNTITIKEKEIVSYHEAGHALVSYLLENVPSPTKISIIPRSKGMLGFSQSIPENEKKLYTYLELISQMKVIMGGRIAEELIFNSVTNGASDDINKITQLSKEIVCTYGMNSQIGLRNIDYDTKNNLWKKESEKLVETIDYEIDGLIKHTYQETKELIETNITLLHQIQELLYQKETIYLEDIDKIYQCKD